MTKLLPARPNLEHLRTQAKALLAKLREGDPEAVRVFADYNPEAARLSPREILDRGFRLADAQAAIARKTGFAAWPGLARHVDRLRSLEGAWTYQSLEVDGQAVPAEMLATSQILMDGDRFRVESPDAVYEGIFNIDLETDPNRIDIDFTEGPEAGNRCEGLFHLDGDRLTICLGLAGSTRPERFATSPGSGHALEVLIRSSHSRPHGVNGGTLTQAPPPSPSSAIEEPFDASPSSTSTALEGEWVALELITAGTPVPPSYLPFALRTHTGVETKVVVGGQTMLHAQTRFNEVANPIEVDYLLLAGKQKGSIAKGLFRWDGDEAVFCTGAPGAPRPDGFTCEPDSNRTLSRWKRKSA